MFYLEKFVAFSYEKAKGKVIIDKRLNMVRGKEISLERQGGYQKLREIGCSLGDIASKIGFSKYVDLRVFKTYKQTNYGQQLPILLW